MAFVAEIFKFIANAIGLVLGVIEDIILWIYNEVLPAVAAALGIVLMALATLAIFAPAFAATLALTLIEIVGATVVFVGDLVVGVVDFTIDTIDMIINNFDEFLAAIHFDLIMDVHEILWILSDDYRALISMLYDAISEVSEVLFGNSYTLLQIFNTTRILILSTTSLLGYEYDIAQISWLSNFGEILRKFNEKAEIYMNDPEQLLLDLEEWAEKAAVDNAGMASQITKLAIKGALAGVKETLIKVDENEGNFQQFAFALPSIRGKHIRQEIDPINLRLGKFQFSSYEKDRFNTNRAVELNASDQERSRARLRGIEYDNERPSRGLSKIDELPPYEKEAEEIAVEDYATRELERDNEELVKQHEEAIEKEEAEKVEEEIYLPPPSWQAITEEERTVLAMSKSRTRNTPFVGDY